MATRMPRLSALPAFSDNYIWMLRDGGRCWVVDPGDADVVLAELKPGDALEGILVTHHHPDHIGGVAALSAAFGCAVLAPEDPRIPLATRRVREGDVVDVLGTAYTVWEVPGHTRSHVAYLGAGRVFCGDTLFSLGCGRLFEGSAAQMLRALDRLSELPEDTEICCTHEYTVSNARFACVVEPDNPVLRDYAAQLPALLANPPHRSLPSTLGFERRCNPFLRIDEPAVRDRLQQHAGRALPDRAERFGVLRGWKDAFRGA